MAAASLPEKRWEPPLPGDEDSSLIGYDDENKHYVPVKGEMINGRYKTIEVLGKGTFGRVLSCQDIKTKQDVAVKIIRSIPKYTRAGQIEVQILQRVKRSPNIVGYDNVVTISDTFYYRDHICMVFPKYGCSLLDLLRYNHFSGFNLDWTRELSRSFLTGVLCLHKNSLIHTDIKPENILTLDSPIATRVRDRVFVHPPGADLVVIDLGSSVPTNPMNIYSMNTSQSSSSSSSNSSRNVTTDHIPIYRPVLICTRQYRPPEIMLGCATEPATNLMAPGMSSGSSGLFNPYAGAGGYASAMSQTAQYPPPIIPYPWDKTVDVFSCGCVIYEIITGRTLFRTHDTLCHLAQMTKILGNPPKEIVQFIRQRIAECNGGGYSTGGCGSVGLGLGITMGGPGSSSSMSIASTLSNVVTSATMGGNCSSAGSNGLTQSGGMTDSNTGSGSNSNPVNTLLQVTPSVVNTYPVLRYFNGKGFDLPSDASEDEIRHYNESVPLRDTILPISPTLHDLLRRMLSWVPAKRGSVAECMRHPFMREEQKETRTVQTDITCVHGDAGTLVSSIMGAGGVGGVLPTGVHPETDQLSALKAENSMLRKQLEQLRGRLFLLQNENDTK